MGPPPRPAMAVVGEWRIARIDREAKASLILVKLILV